MEAGALRRGGRRCCTFSRVPFTRRNSRDPGDGMRVPFRKAGEWVVQPPVTFQMPNRRDKRWRTIRVIASVAAVLAAALAGQSAAIAASDSVSTLYKTGTDTTSGDSAASPETPGLPNGAVA